MSGFPSLAFALLQGLLTSLLMTGPFLAIAFGGKLRTTLADVGLAAATVPASAALTILVFLPFEGDWAVAALGPLVPFRALLVGALAVTLGMAVTQRKGLMRRGASDAVLRLATAFLIGAVWGAAWSFAGWCVAHIGVLGNG